MAKEGPPAAFISPSRCRTLALSLMRSFLLTANNLPLSRPREQLLRLAHARAFLCQLRRELALRPRPPG